MPRLACVFAECAGCVWVDLDARILSLLGEWRRWDAGSVWSVCGDSNEAARGDYVVLVSSLAERYWRCIYCIRFEALLPKSVDQRMTI